MLNLLYRVMQPRTIYRGVVIININGGYKTIGRLFGSLQLAKNAIDESFVIIAESIKRAACAE